MRWVFIQSSLQYSQRPINIPKLLIADSQNNVYCLRILNFLCQSIHILNCFLEVSQPKVAEANTIEDIRILPSKNFHGLLITVNSLRKLILVHVAFPLFN